MSIRDRVRRALRTKSDTDASDSASQSDSSPATPVSSNTSQSSDGTQSLTSKLSRTFTFGSRDKMVSSSSSSSAAPREKPRRKRPVHPSERPLTTQNLKHQEMLGQFTMTFGTANLSQLDLDGVSPCCTRAPSMDLGTGPSPFSRLGRPSISEDEIAPA